MDGVTDVVREDLSFNLDGEGENSGAVYVILKIEG